MLAHARLVEKELTVAFDAIAHDMKYKFSEICAYRTKYTTKDSTWNEAEFASVHKGKVLGYFRMAIDRECYSVSYLQIVNFSDPNIHFGKDLMEFIDNVFTKYGYR